MPDNTSLLLAALERTRSMAGKSLTVTPLGFQITGAFGDHHDLLIAHEHVRPDIAVLSETINRDFRANGWRGNWETDRDFGRLGLWTLNGNGAGGFSLKPKSTFIPCLDPFLDAHEDDLARLRSLYRENGVDVFFLVQGDSRARDIAIALHAERTLVGLPGSLSLLDEQSYGTSRHALDPIPVDIFDADISAGSGWDIQQVSTRAYTDALLAMDDDNSGSRIYVATPLHPGSDFRRFEMVRRHLDKRDRPTVCIFVELKDSKPSGTFAFSSSAMSMTCGDPGFDNAPWDKFNAKRRPRTAPKTWHSTTEAVARHYVDRTALRGYVSSKSIYFHGPVAYSISDRNPIAAIVDAPAGKPFLFIGRQNGWGGTSAGTISSAQGDITSAANGRFRIEHVDDLQDFIRLGRLELSDLPARFRRLKDEADHPIGCSIDRRAFARWFQSTADARFAELDDAEKSSFPTLRIANAYRSLEQLCLKRDALMSAFSLNLHDIGTHQEYKRLYDEAYAAAKDRQARLESRANSDDDGLASYSPSVM